MKKNEKKHVLLFEKNTYFLLLFFECSFGFVFRR
jgi:hypothetical protein